MRIGFGSEESAHRGEASAIGLRRRPIEFGNRADHGGLEVGGEFVALDAADVVVHEGGGVVVDLVGLEGTRVFGALIDDHAGIDVDGGSCIVRALGGKLVPEVEAFDELRDGEGTSGHLLAGIVDLPTLADMAQTSWDDECLVRVHGGDGLAHALGSLLDPRMHDGGKVRESWRSDGDGRQAFRDEGADGRREASEGIRIGRDAQELPVAASTQDGGAHSLEALGVHVPLAVGEVLQDLAEFVELGDAVPLLAHESWQAVRRLDAHGGVLVAVLLDVVFHVVDELPQQALGGALFVEIGQHEDLGDQGEHGCAVGNGGVSMDDQLGDQMLPSRDVVPVVGGEWDDVLQQGFHVHAAGATFDLANELGRRQVAVSSSRAHEAVERKEDDIVKVDSGDVHRVFDVSQATSFWQAVLQDGNARSEDVAVDLERDVVACGRDIGQMHARDLGEVFREVGRLLDVLESGSLLQEGDALRLLQVVVEIVQELDLHVAVDLRDLGAGVHLQRDLVLIVHQVERHEVQEVLLSVAADLLAQELHVILHVQGGKRLAVVVPVGHEVLEDIGSARDVIGVRIEDLVFHLVHGSREGVFRETVGHNLQQHIIHFSNNA
mmetsp:Transcript_15256/g.43022  ORF Transcript_15256/g.43022 Transcript_15256/m.43022 type:complete len:607 (-) Transcript_15256:1223-3043(-)